MWQLSEKGKLEFIDDKFYIEGIDGRLVQQDTNNPKIYNGSFIIRQRSRAFEITVFIPDIDPNSLIKNSMQNGLKTGSIIPESHYYILEGLDLKGRKWYSNEFYPSFHTHINYRGALFKGAAQEIYFERKTDSANINKIHLDFLDSFNIPAHEFTETIIRSGKKEKKKFTRNVWRFKDGDISYTFTNETYGLSVDVENNRAFPSDFISYINETLWFVFARLIHPSIEIERKNNSVKCLLRVLEKPRLTPLLSPLIRLDHINAPTIAKEMFIKYIRYISKNKSELLHPISVELKKVIRASQHSLDAQSLFVAVAVEAILKSQYPEIDIKEEEENEEIDLVQENIKNFDISSRLKDRLTGLIGAMKKSHPKNKLIQLKERGVINEEHIKAWERLRHTVTHGDIDSINFNDRCNLCSVVSQLMYLLVFDLVGYKGIFTDYTKEGYPDLHFPFRFKKS
ncbi:MAG: hypothetical protein FJW63_03685 [Actinobacteria bacterium]|nr:hypothetical protein [Actinomycetota bacterium]